MKLESVSGLSQQALLIDVAAKVLVDNLASLLCNAASIQADLPARLRKCNRSYAATFVADLLPRLLLLIGDVCAAIHDAIAMMAANTQRHEPRPARPRPKHQAKPHPSQA